MNKQRKKHKQLTIITIIFSIISLVFLSTIAYSAFSSTMNITGMAHTRVEANLRITDFKLESTTNAISSYEDFGKEHISTSIDFKENASATYKVEVTNYGTTDVGIYNITGLPENISYELIDYNLKDKICDLSNKCNSFIKKVFYIKFTGSNINTDLNIKFEFRVIHNISYINFTGNYQKTVYDQESLTINVSQDSPIFINVESNKNIIYNYENKIITLKNIISNVTVSAIKETVNEFQYIENYQAYTVPVDGTYHIELWGARGGNKGGLGGYTSGDINLTKNTKLYFYVGPEGKKGISDLNDLVYCEFNCGTYTSGQYYNPSRYWGTGGGATDVRLTSGNWNDFNSLKSRIMVAGAGGGRYEGDGYELPGGASGGLIGYNGQPEETFASSTYGSAGYGGTQISGGYNIINNENDYFYTSSSLPLGTYGHGSFGKGGNSALGYAFAGGGTGYYGGGSSMHIQSAGGASSFISGHNGCDAIKESSTSTNIIHTGQSIHYSGYKFTNTKMIDGAGYTWTTAKGAYTGMPTHDGKSTMTGNEGNGYAKITLLKVKDQYNITYTNITGNYKNTIYKGNDLVVDFSSNAPDMVKVLEEGIEKEFTYKNGIVTVKNVTGNIEIKPVDPTYKFNYTGDYQTFTVPYNGVYKIELWGASGSKTAERIHQETIGKGGYTSGIISLNKNTQMYLYIGGFDDFNGRGYGEAPGGSATDIRLIGGAWDDFSSLKSRIMVAAGGGGGVFISHEYEGDSPGDAGGLIGYDANYNSGGYGFGYSGHGATQTSGGLPGKSSDVYQIENSNYGHFGVGGYMYLKNSDGFYGYPSSGGGSGYYGGGHGVHPGSTWSGAGGGSSFISGHNGCNAITGSSTSTNIVHTGQSVHYSGYKFTNTKIIDGRGYNWTNEKNTEVVGMPNFEGNATMIGNETTGYAKITLLEVN